MPPTPVELVPCPPPPLPPLLPTELPPAGAPPPPPFAQYKVVPLLTIELSLPLYPLLALVE